MNQKKYLLWEKNMINTSKIKLLALAVGTTLSTFSVMSAPALAAVATIGSGNCNGASIGSYLLNQGIQEDTFKTNCSTTDIGIVQGRTGGASTYEIGIGLNGAQAGLTDQLDLPSGWVDETTYYWKLVWDTNDPVPFPEDSLGGGTAQFYLYSDTGYSTQIGSVLDYSFIGNLDTFNALGLVVRADDLTGYGTGTTMNLTLNEVKTNLGILEDLDTNALSITATSGTTRYDKQFLTINPSGGNTEFTELRGTVKVDYVNNSFNPLTPSLQSAGIGFEIKLFDPPVTTPEPGVMLGLLGVGMFGSRLKKR